MTQSTPSTVSSEPRDFFIPVDVELIDRLGDEFTPITFAVLCVVLRQVDYETGIWKGSAARIEAALGGQTKQRTIQDALLRLQKAGILKSFHKHGQRHNYLVAVHRYPIRFGKWTGYMLDADRTTDPKSPIYVKREATTQRLRKVNAGETSKPPSASDLEKNSLRNDSAKTEKNNSPLRSDCATTPHPHARYPDYPDSPENNNNAKSMDADGGEKFLGSASPSQSSPSNKELLLAIATTLHRHKASTLSSAKHREQASGLVAEHGVENFIRALDFWLANDGQKWINGRDWVLAHFVASGAFEDSLSRVKAAEASERQAMLDAEHKRAEEGRQRGRRILGAELKSATDRVTGELRAWRDKYGTDDGFVPSSPDAYRLVMLQQQYDDAVSRQDAGCKEIWKKIDELKNEWITMRESEVAGVN